MEVDFSTESCGGVILQPDKAGRLWPVGCCSGKKKLKGDECYWTTLEGMFYTICYRLREFADFLRFCLGVEIRAVVPGVATAIALDHLGA